MRFLLLAAACGTVLSGAPARAASLTSLYSGFYVLGDSLSDPGNVFAATGGTIPPQTITIGGTDYPGYFQGRVSNGPVWAERFTGAFAAAGLPSGNFAYALANAVTNADPVPDLPAQLGLFAAAVAVEPPGANPLVAIWAGANDLFSVADDPTKTLTEVQAKGTEAALAVAGSVAALAAGGIDDFVLFSLPDLGATPAYALFNPSRAPVATGGTQAFNATLGTQADLLRAGGLNVTEVDIAGLFDALLADPTAFGLTDAVSPCIVGAISAGTFYSVCDPATVPGRVFYDPVHPTAAVHAIVADAVQQAVAPVPLPGALPLLAAALGALAVVRRRA